MSKIPYSDEFSYTTYAINASQRALAKFAIGLVLLVCLVLWVSHEMAWRFGPMHH